MFDEPTIHHIAHHCWTENHQMDWDNISVKEQTSEREHPSRSIYPVYQLDIVHNPRNLVKNVKSTERNFGATNDRN